MRHENVDVGSRHVQDTVHVVLRQVEVSGGQTHLGVGRDALEDTPRACAVRFDAQLAHLHQREDPRIRSRRCALHRPAEAALFFS